MFWLYRYLLNKCSQKTETSEGEDDDKTSSEGNDFLANLNELYSFNLQVGTEYTITNPAFVIEFYLSPLVFFIGVLMYILKYEDAVAEGRTGGNSNKRVYDEEETLGYILEGIYIPNAEEPNFLIDLPIDKYQFAFILGLSFYDNSNNI